MKAQWIILPALLFLLGGCSPSHTEGFAGFTFGGGGHTHSAEPAKVIPSKGKLLAGSDSTSVELVLTWQPGPTAEKLPLKSARTRVDALSVISQLESGFIVLQASQGNLVHGSYDFVSRSEDGREFKVVGSFTAPTAEP